MAFAFFTREIVWFSPHRRYGLNGWIIRASLFNIQGTKTMNEMLRNGDIVEIILPKGLGFAYGMYIDLLKIDQNTSYPCLLRFYNKRFEISVSMDKLQTDELILCPHLVSGAMQIIKNKDWRVIGNRKPTTEELKIPHYKFSNSSSMILQDPFSEWYYVDNADISRKHRTNYLQVKHLESLGATGASLVSTKVAMALLKDEGKEILDWFDLGTFYEKVYYAQVSDIEAYYKMPKQLQGKVLLY